MDLEALYNTGCVPLNMYLVLGTLATVSALVALVRLNEVKKVEGLQGVSWKEVAIALVITVVAVVVIGAVFKGLCASAGGQIAGYVIVAALLLGVAWVTTELYARLVVKRELEASNWVRNRYNIWRAKRGATGDAGAPTPVAAGAPTPVAAAYW
jgi:hypothetical protein